MCKCVDIKIGSYDNQVELTLPPHMAEHKAKQGGANTICIDKCLIGEILQLWRAGITTTGCCCGHNKVPGFISVTDADINKMRELGYITHVNKMMPNSNNHFKPKYNFMQNNKPRKGSMAEAEQKSEKTILIALGLITLLVWLAWFVFDTDQRAFMRRASWLDNIGGSILIFGSWVWLYFGAKNDWDGKAVIGWLLLLALGLTWSTGFNFDYLGVK